MNTKGVEDGITDAPVLTSDAPEMDYEHAGKVAYAEQRVVEFRAIPTGQKFAAHPEGHYIALTRPPAAPVAKPGPRQATPFMPERVLTALDRIGYRTGSSEDEKAMKFIENELMDVWEHHSIRPTLPVPERTAEMEELMASLRDAAEAAEIGHWEVIRGKGGEGWTICNFGVSRDGTPISIETMGVRASELRCNAYTDANFVAWASPENILKLLDHIEGKG